MLRDIFDLTLSRSMLYVVLASLVLLSVFGLIFYAIRNKPKVIILGIAAGFIIVFPAAIINLCLKTILQLSEWQLKVIFGPIVEESLKLSSIAILAALDRHSILRSNIKLCGASVGLGFAFLENLSASVDFLNAFARFPSWSMHIFDAFLISYGVGFIQKSRLKRAALLLVSAFSAAVLSHSLYNLFWLSLGFA